MDVVGQECQVVVKLIPTRNAKKVFKKKPKGKTFMNAPQVISVLLNSPGLYIILCCYTWGGGGGGMGGLPHF